MMNIKNEVRNVLTIIELEARRLRHDYTDIAVRAIQPIVWLLVFGTVFSKNRVIDTGGYSYLSFVAPGILAQAVLFVAIFFGIMLVWDRDSGNLAKLLVAPASRFSLVIGKCFSASVRAIAQAVVVISLILMLSLFVTDISLSNNPVYILLTLPVVVLIAAVAASISILFATIFRTRERVMGFGQLLTLPLFFTSSALYPIEIMPWYLQWMAKVNPLTYGVDLLRGLMLTGDLSNALLDVGVLLGFLAVMSLACTALFRRMME
ncbi:MAG: ABC transporter permease [Euryarchaeota archaeon]|nr:ABC transporter permease [Euryarchaeota archaeon]